MTVPISKLCIIKDAWDLRNEVPLVVPAKTGKTENKTQEGILATVNEPRGAKAPV